jgi:hypothetical protein
VLNDPNGRSDSTGLYDDCQIKTILYLKAATGAILACVIPEPAQPIACAVAVLITVFAAQEMMEACNLECPM